MAEEACIFCQIAAKRIPARIVYEDENFLAFLDIRPLNPGHTLLIPKQHYFRVNDVPNFGEYWETAKRVAIGITKALNALFVSYATVGLEVPHAHIWIIPRFDNDGHGGIIDWSNIKKIPDEEMDEIAQKIRSNIPPKEVKEEKVEEPKEEEPKKERSKEETYWIKRELDIT